MRGIYRIKMVQCKDFGLESTECPVELLYWTSPRAEDLADFIYLTYLIIILQVSQRPSFWSFFFGHPSSYDNTLYFSNQFFMRWQPQILELLLHYLFIQKKIFAVFCQTHFLAVAAALGSKLTLMNHLACFFFHSHVKAHSGLKTGIL